MRLLIALGGLLCVGCVAPHSTGGLWALQELQQELAQFRLSELQRTEQAHAVELQVADETLASERARVSTAIEACPGNQRAPLTLSTADRTRDTVRIQVAGDAERLKSVARLALADWYIRRALASGQSDLCDRARQTLLGASPALGRATVSTALDALGTATVLRDPRGTARPYVPDPGDDPLTALSLYASGVTNAVTATAPLPQYLAAVYGGSLASQPASHPDAEDLAAEQRVDDLAPLYPWWEPDALYETLRAR